MKKGKKEMTQINIRISKKLYKKLKAMDQPIAHYVRVALKKMVKDQEYMDQ